MTGLPGKWPTKEGFIERDILDPDDMPVREFDDLIDQQEGKAVGQGLFDLLGVKTGG
jgi:hypothetical protein